MKTPNTAIINHLVNHNQLGKNKHNLFLRIGTICYTILILLIFGCVNPVKSQSLNNTDQIKFYGNNSTVNQPGADYLVFRENNHQIKGLIYVQNSDVFSCVSGNYNHELNQVENVTFSYQELGSDVWETINADEPLLLNEFPYQFNYSLINENANALFLECLER